MKVYKFGGASVKSAEAVRNAVYIISSGMDEGAVVISAMGKTTNALEKICALYVDGTDFEPELNNLCSFHNDIANDLDPSGLVLEAALQVQDDLEKALNETSSGNVSVEYDRIVSFGELWSTKIVAAYASLKGLQSEWFDVRNVIITDEEHMGAKVLWPECEKRCGTLKGLLGLDGCKIIITQGFISRSEFGNTTTLGREGSDYSGAILAHLLDATELVIWKDVPGMLNADPKWFKETRQLTQISYREAIELSYFGASVIHPKTIKPLQNKSIPLWVKSFQNPDAKGTLIHNSTDHDSAIPSYIFKPNQLLLSISPKDFSFVDEGKMAELFALFSELQVHIQLIQNSALNLSVCIDGDEAKRDMLINEIRGSYTVRYNTGLELWTVRHYTQKIEQQITRDKELILRQSSRNTLRMLLSPTKPKE